MRILFFSLIGVLMSMQLLEACDCDMIPVSEKSIESTELIFIGKVVAISGCEKTAKVTFAVDELFRGKAFANTELEFDCSSDCQMSFLPGQTWLIYATYKKYGEAIVKFCSYSRQQFSNETSDYNSAVHGMTFMDEKVWLKKTLGVQQLNVREVQAEQHHENIRPDGNQVIWYLGFGLLGIGIIYFLGKKFIK